MLTQENIAKLNEFLAGIQEGKSTGDLARLSGLKINKATAPSISSFLKILRGLGVDTFKRTRVGITVDRETFAEFSKWKASQSNGNGSSHAKPAPAKASGRASPAHRFT